MTTPPNDLSPAALAYQWVSRIMAVTLVMVVPGVFGQWLDQRWGTELLAPLGFVFGLVAGMYHLLVMTDVIKKKPKSNSTKKDEQP